MTVKKIENKAQYDEVLASGKLVFIDFYADWCGPCKQISPLFGKLAEDHAKEGVEFYQLNVDDVAEAAQEAGISSIPAFHVYKDSVRIEKFVGANAMGLRGFVQNFSSV